MEIIFSNKESNNHQPFSLKEQLDSLNKSHDSSSGPEEIHYKLHKKNLPDISFS